MMVGCRNVNVYERLGYCGEGTYGKVFKAREKETGRVFALKKVGEAALGCTALRWRPVLAHAALRNMLRHGSSINMRQRCW
jgi:hypothetical protein